MGSDYTQIHADKYVSKVAINNLKPSTIYHFWVMIDYEGMQTKASLVSATTQAGVAPGAPTNLRVEHTAEDIVTIRWTPGSSGNMATTFRVGYKVKNDAMATYTYVDNVGGAMYHLTGVYSNTEFDFTV